MYFWINVRTLVLKMAESERIDAPAVPLTILAFSGVVPTVVLRGMFGASAQYAPE